jgi:hypothetical protein
MAARGDGPEPADFGIEPCQFWRLSLADHADFGISPCQLWQLSMPILARALLITALGDSDRWRYRRRIPLGELIGIPVALARLRSGK